MRAGGISQTLEELADWATPCSLPALHRFDILFLSGIGAGAELLSRTLRSRGHAVEVVPGGEAAKEDGRNYQFVLAAAFYHNIPELKAAIELLREQNPSIRVILGGPAFTSAPEFVFRELRADYGLRGEADITISELFSVFERHGVKPSYRDVEDIDGAVFRGPHRRILRNSKLPVVTQEQFEKIPLIIDRRAENAAAGLPIQRGCPACCVFCENPFGRRVRTMKVEDILSALEDISSDPEIDIIVFEMEQFLPGKKARAFLKGIIERGLNSRFQFFSQFSVNALQTKTSAGRHPNLELIALLQEANFTYVWIGVESFSDNMIGDLKAGRYTGREAVELIRALQRAGIGGHPFSIETSPNMRLADKIEDMYVRSTVSNRGEPLWGAGEGGDLQAIPGTPLFAEYLRQPEKLVNLSTLRPLPENTNLPRYITKKLPKFLVIPEDSVALHSSGVGALYAMEYRAQYIRESLGKNGVPEGHQENYITELLQLERELPQARKRVRGWYREILKGGARELGENRIAHYRKIQESPGFLEEFEKEHPEHFRIIKAAADSWAKEPFGEGEEEEDLETRRDWALRTLIVEYIQVRPRLTPDTVFRAYAAEFYDHFCSVDIQHLAAQYRLGKFDASLFEDGVEHLREALASRGKEGFIEEFTAPGVKDPVAAINRYILAGLLHPLPLKLLKIKSDEDSRKVMRKRRNDDGDWSILSGRKVRRLARMIPESRKA